MEFFSKFRLFFVPFLFTLAVPAFSQHGNEELTLESVIEGEFLPKPAGIRFQPSENGACYTTLSPDRKRIEEYRFDNGEKVATLLDLSVTDNGNQIEAIENYLVGPGGNEILIFTNVEPVYRRSWRADAYRYDVRRGRISPLSKHPGKIMIPTFSPDARMVAFVRDNNIFIAKFDYDTEVAVTTDGVANKIINGSTDWVYEEEFRSTRLLSWSEDGKYLAFGRFDEEAIPEYGFQLYAQNEQVPFAYMYKYPFAGEKNSSVSVHIYNTQQKNTREVKLPIEEDGYIPRLEFTEMDNQLAVFTLNRHQNEFKLYFVNPASLVSHVALSDRDNAYISEELTNTLVIEKDGFVMLSERGRYSQLYRFNRQGGEEYCLTPGTYDVTNVYGVDKKGNVYYQAADQSPISRRILKVSPKGKITVIAGERGVNQASFSRDFSYGLISRSHGEMPTLHTILRTTDNKTLRTLEDNAELKAKLARYRFPTVEFTTIKVKEGLEFNAYLIKPTHFDPNKKYPLLMVQYGGPNSQEVLDIYTMDWTRYLAEQGYIVACVDGRGTGARGSDWRKCTYLKMGIYESDDQIAAAKAIGALPYVDSSRIGIWGWSFGGYNSLLCLCRGGGIFKAGIAVAPVTDWSFYDTIYTERFLRTPQENPSGYQEGAPLHMAKNLKGNLLIIHGSADDNVHLRNTMLFIEELIQADIPFEMAIYPNKNHGIYGGNTQLHLYKRKIDFLKRCL